MHLTDFNFNPDVYKKRELMTSRVWPDIWQCRFIPYPAYPSKHAGYPAFGKKNQLNPNDVLLDTRGPRLSIRRTGP